jgi:hypothetical protein
MASLARAKVKRAQIICGDITGQERILDQKFDLITAFRFFLNAEPPLRVAAMRALGERLRDESSWLIFNNHGNLWSHKLLMWPYHKLRQRRRAQPLAGNYLSHREIVRLVEEAGLKIERVLGAGVLSAKAIHLVSPERLLRWERRLAFGRTAKLGGSQLYVVRRAR